MKGLVHIYTGDGKGKTSAAIGLGIRACGRGMKVLMLQFMKGSETGEMYAIKRLEPDFVLDIGRKTGKFTWQMNETELKELKTYTHEMLGKASAAAFSGDWDLIILDEIMVAISCNLIDEKEVADLILNKPERLELVMTGRNAPAALAELADYISEIRAVKHPMEKGIPARKGIEY